MEFPPHAGLLAAEFLGVLLSFPGEFFSPGEMAVTLRACPGWSQYLNGFEQERGQPAAIGRYLNELGLTKSGHHRSRGSLYASAAAQARLGEALEQARAKAAAEMRHEVLGDDPEFEPLDSERESKPESDHEHIVPAAAVAAAALEPTPEPWRPQPVELSLPPRALLGPHLGPMPEAAFPPPADPLPTIDVPTMDLTPPTFPTLGATPGRRAEDRRGEIARSPGEMRSGDEVMARGGDANRRAGDRSESAATAAAPARGPQVIGWRRRSTDLVRSPRPQAGSGHAEPLPAAPYVAQVPPPQQAPAYAALPPAAPAYPVAYGGPPQQPAPVWVGGGATYPGALPVPYSMPEFAAPVQAADEAGLPLAFYWNQIRRHFLKILLGTGLVTLLVGFYTLRIPKLYESVVTLRMDFNHLPVGNSDNSDPNSDANDPTTLIQTEVTDATQRSVVLDAINLGHLDQDPVLTAPLKAGRGAVPTATNPSAVLDPLIAEIQAGATAIPPDNTHNIDIHFQSHDPATSAAVANALANALITHEYTTRLDEQQTALNYMQKQFDDIKTNVENETRDLQDYQHQTNIFNPNDRDGLETATVSNINTSFLAAQADDLRYQAEENALQVGNLAALLANDDSAPLRAAYDALNAAQSQFDLDKQRAGKNNPVYKIDAEKVAGAQVQLTAAEAIFKSQVESRLAKAKSLEELFQTALDKAKSNAQQFNDKAIDYDIKRRTLDADQAMYDDLQKQIKAQELTASISSSDLRVTNPATPNAAPVYPDVRKNVTLAALFGLFFGCCLAVGAGYMDRSFTTPEGVEQYLRIPLLAALPIITNKANLIELADHPVEHDNAAGEAKAAPRSAFAESILMLRTAVLYAAPHGFRSMCITSAQPQEGKSVILANLGISLALHSSKVLIIDGDIRRPTLHRIFEVPNQVGLSSLLRQSSSLEECFRATTVEKLYIMPAGPAVPNPSELLATMLPQVLAPLTAEFDYVLIDSPPVLGFADAVSISTVVEGTLLVARAGKTQRELVQAALQPLKRVRARVLGLVLNQVSSSLSPYYSYYRDHYARYYGGSEEEAAPAAKSRS